MTSENNTRQIIWKMGFEKFDFVLPVNRSTDIWVLWNNNEVHALALNKDNHAIHLLVHNPTIPKNILVSRIYGPAQSGDHKDSFWNNLTHLNIVIDLVWCLVGDFNDLSAPFWWERGKPNPFKKSWKK